MGIHRFGEFSEYRQRRLLRWSCLPTVDQKVQRTGLWIFYDDCTFVGFYPPFAERRGSLDSASLTLRAQIEFRLGLERRNANH
jgi:hypothetical protein